MVFLFLFFSIFIEIATKDLKVPLKIVNVHEERTGAECE